ncbi:MAG: hypothetical protein U9R57_02530 [Thermodesulfobacteriota bacterium]|nr:hypothetical protein [Thermodesulfobacteriota bacterium]
MSILGQPPTIQDILCRARRIEVSVFGKELTLSSGQPKFQVANHNGSGIFLIL